MKKLLLLFIVFASCKKEIYYYPSEEFFKKNNPKEINLDNLSFWEIKDSIYYELYRGNRLFIELENQRKIYKISPFTYMGGLIKEKNVLEIYQDSLWFFNKRQSINQLDKLIKIHYENNGKIPYLPDSHKRAFVKLTLEPEDNTEKLKAKLLYIVQVYNKAIIKNKDSIDLNIMLDYYFDKVDPPTIPSAPQPLIKEE